MARTEFRIGDEGVNGYRLLNSLVVPRPIAWVSTLDARGRANLAPHSFFSVASSDPPTVMFTSVGDKDTLRNVRETGEFVVSVASAPLLHWSTTRARRSSTARTRPSSSGSRWSRLWRSLPHASPASPASIECRLDRLVGGGVVDRGASAPSCW
jgi:flavin reductase (DIM6/NTAB) family NADH-FMN oxidoreductase RutF